MQICLLFSFIIGGKWHFQGGLCVIFDGWHTYDNFHKFWTLELEVAGKRFPNCPITYETLGGVRQCHVDSPFSRRDS